MRLGLKYFGNPSPCPSFINVIPLLCSLSLTFNQIAGTSSLEIAETSSQAIAATSSQEIEATSSQASAGITCYQDYTMKVSFVVMFKVDRFFFTRGSTLKIKIPHPKSSSIV